MHENNFKNSYFTCTRTQQSCLKNFRGLVDFKPSGDSFLQQLFFCTIRCLLTLFQSEHSLFLNEKHFFKKKQDRRSCSINELNNQDNLQAEGLEEA